MGEGWGGGRAKGNKGHKKDFFFAGEGSVARLKFTKFYKKTNKKKTSGRHTGDNQGSIMDEEEVVLFKVKCFFSVLRSSHTLHDNTPKINLKNVKKAEYV